ncbi:MFS transporter [Microbacterium sp. A84]
MIIICLALLLEGMSTSGINVQLGALRTELSLSDGELQLVASAFLIAYAGLLPIAGALADRLDRRRVFLAGIALFGLGCVVCAVAPSSALLIVGRVIQGAGAALSAPAALALITAGLPEGASRNRAVAIYGAMGAVGFSLGLVVPGAAVTWFGWRWSFLISVPAVVLVFAATYGIHSASIRAQGRPDIIGAVLLTICLMLTVHLVGALTTLAPLALAIEGILVILLATWLIARRGVRDIPRSVVSSPRVRAACLGLGGLFAGVVGSMYALSLGLSDGQGASALAVALLIVPQPILFSLSAGVGARLVTTWGAPRVFALGAGVFILSLLWLGSAHGAPVWVGILPSMAGVGISLGLCFPAASVGAVDATPPETRATTAGLLTTAQNIGGAMGIATLTALSVVPTAASGLSIATAMFWSAGFAATGLLAAAIVLLRARLRTDAAAAATATMKATAAR